MLIPLGLVALVAGQEPAPPPRAIPMTFSDHMARSDADAKAAREAFAAGRYREALDAFTRWKPVHLCGTGRIGLERERRHRIIRCHTFLCGHAVAARLCLDALAQRTGRCGWEAAILFEVYHEAGQLDDLRRMLDPLEAIALDNFLKHVRIPPSRGGST